MDWITPGIIGGAVLTGSALIGIAITEHSTVLQQFMERHQVPQTITDDNWRSPAIQAIADWLRK